MPRPGSRSQEPGPSRGLKPVGNRASGVSGASFDGGSVYLPATSLPGGHVRRGFRPFPSISRCGWGEVAKVGRSSGLMGGQRHRFPGGASGPLPRPQERAQATAASFARVGLTMSDTPSIQAAPLSGGMTTQSDAGRYEGSNLRVALGPAFPRPEPTQGHVQSVWEPQGRVRHVTLAQSASRKHRPDW